MKQNDNMDKYENEVVNSFERNEWFRIKLFKQTIKSLKKAAINTIRKKNRKRDKRKV